MDTDNIGKYGWYGYTEGIDDELKANVRYGFLQIK